MINILRNKKFINFFKSILKAVIITLFLIIAFFYISKYSDFNGYYIKPMKFCYFMIFIGLLLPKKSPSKFLNTLVIIITIWLFIYLSYLSLEMWQGNNLAEPFDGLEMMKIRLKINYFILLTILLLVFSVFATIKRSIYILTVFVGILGFSNYIILQFRGEALLPTDWFALNTAISVSSSYTLKFYSQVFSALLCLFTILVWNYHIRPIKIQKKTRNSLRLICGILGLIFVYTFNILDFEEYYYPWFIPNNGYPFTLAVNFKMLNLKPDTSYDSNVIYNYLTELEDSSILNTNYDPTEKIIQKFGTNKKANIICIMNESWANLPENFNLEVTDDLFNNIRSLGGESIQGDLVVEVFGGGTSDTEFTFLTGNSTKLFPNNARAYELYVKDTTSSIVKNLKKQGYQTIAIHPDKSTNWNRNNVYPILGFDQFITEENFTDSEIVRDLYVSDNATYKKIEDLFDSKGDKPLFIFDITMQNHGSYDQSYNNLDRVEIIGEDYPLAEQYLSLINKTDEDFMELVKFFENYQEPTIILMFGDHLPKLEEDFYDSINVEDLESLRYKFTTPFIIWANYELPKDEVETISINYLSTLLVEVSGTEKTAFNNYLAHLYNIYPVIDKYGVLTDNKEVLFFDELSEDQKDIITEYDNIIYDNTLTQSSNNKNLYN